MTDAPKPGSAEEAAARRNIGKGPFSAEKAEFDCLLHEVVEVVDTGGNRFCVVFPDDCVGGDLTAARARATRVAEVLNGQLEQASGGGPDDEWMMEVRPVADRGRLPTYRLTLVGNGPEDLQRAFDSAKEQFGA